MSETTAAPKRRYQRIAPEHLKYARIRFENYATTTVVQREIERNFGVTYPYNALYFHWKKANPPASQFGLVGAAGDAQGGGE